MTLSQPHDKVVWTVKDTASLLWPPCQSPEANHGGTQMEGHFLNFKNIKARKTEKEQASILG